MEQVGAWWSKSGSKFGSGKENWKTSTTDWEINKPIVVEPGTNVDDMKNANDENGSLKMVWLKRKSGSRKSTGTWTDSGSKGARSSSKWSPWSNVKEGESTVIEVSEEYLMNKWQSGAWVWETWDNDWPKRKSRKSNKVLTENVNLDDLSMNENE